MISPPSWTSTYSFTSIILIFLHSSSSFLQISHKYLVERVDVANLSIIWMLFFFVNTKFMIDSYVNQVQSLPCLCQLLLKVVNWICLTFYMDLQSYYMYLSSWKHVFLALCQTKPNWSLTKILSLVEASPSKSYFFPSPFIGEIFCW